MGKVLAIVGMSSSGKGTVTDYLESKGYRKVYFGGMVYEEVEKRGLDIVLDERNVREDMRKKEGPAVLAKRAATRAKEHFADGANTVVFDGLYSWSELRYLEEEFGDDLIVAAILVPKKLRWQRGAERQDSHRKYTEQQVKMRDIEEIENLEKGGPIAYADHYFSNVDTPESLVEDVEAFMNDHQLKA